MVMSVGPRADSRPQCFISRRTRFFKALLFPRRWLGDSRPCTTSRTFGTWATCRHKLPVTLENISHRARWALRWRVATERLLLEGFHSGAGCRNTNRFFFALGVFVAFLTAFYMFRLLFVVFFPANQERRGRARATNLHAS